jgi:hypothetical protein
MYAEYVKEAVVINFYISSLYKEEADDFFSLSRGYFYGLSIAYFFSMNDP